ARYHRLRGDKVKLVSGFDGAGYEPDKIYITSLFTYAWEPVHEAIRYYRAKYPKARLTVGGIYATLCPERLREEFGNSISIRRGTSPELDSLRPDYSLVPDWDASIVFATRGCVRSCPFCSVKLLEPKFTALKSIRRLVHPKHRRIIFWDNNILASTNWRDIFAELAELQKPVDFN
ncbi:MAG: Fe-S oxidoreductase, partial [candidate division WOR-3 bacterium]